ncbi:MAG: hypothetical protein J5759_04710 [Bacteroidales bacterium]|nr:hypothetical protein [Bacteroidales bacterium]
MKHLLCFLSIALLFISCGRSADDDTVLVSLTIKNYATADIYVETNFPSAVSYNAEPAEGRIAVDRGLTIFDWYTMRRVRSFDDFLSQLFSLYPEAKIWIYSVNEENAKGDLLLSCPLTDIPGAIWGEDHGHFHFNTNPNEYPRELWFGFAWNGKELTSGL